MPFTKYHDSFPAFKLEGERIVNLFLLAQTGEWRVVEVTASSALPVYLWRLNSSSYLGTVVAEHH